MLRVITRTWSAGRQTVWRCLQSAESLGQRFRRRLLTFRAVASFLDRQL
jgi:hypothetical protein